MFAPENYVRWIDLVPELHEWANRILLAHELEEGGKDPSIAFNAATIPEAVRIAEANDKFKLLDPSDDPISWDAQRRSDFSKVISEVEFTSSLIAFKYVSEILLQFDTLVCSPEGQTMRAPDLMLLHSDRLDWCYLDVPIRNIHEFQYYFELFDEGRLNADDIADRFCFIDPFMGTITLKNNSLTNMAKASHINLNSNDVERFYQQGVKPYLGNSIVWSAKKFPDEVVDLLDAMRFFETHWKVKELFDPKSARKLATQKRGAKPTGAKDEYFRLYPKGKPSDVSFEAIAAELAEAGFPISARQVQNYERGRTIS